MGLGRRPLRRTTPTSTRPREGAEQDAAGLYLARLASPESRRVQRGALDVWRRAFIALGLPDPPWAALDPRHIAAARVGLAARYGPATLRRLLAALRGLLLAAGDLGALPAGRARELARWPAVRGTPAPAGRALDGPDLGRLYACAGTDAAGARDRAIVALLYLGGLRRAEAAGLDVEDFDGQALRVRGKGERWRVVPCADALVRALRGWLAVRGNVAGALLCPVRGRRSLALGRRLSGADVGALVVRLGRRAGVACTAHDLRRACVGAALDAGADLAAVARLVGHARVDTTARYDRRPARAVAAVVRRLPAFEAGEPGDTGADVPELVEVGGNVGRR